MTAQTRAELTGGIVGVVMARGRETPKQLAIIENRRGRWVPITAGELATRVGGLAAGLVAYGVGSGRRVGIVMSNQAEWIVADLGIQAAGGVSVAVPPTDDDEELAGFIGAAGFDVVVVDDIMSAQRIDGLAAAGRIDPIRLMIQRGRTEGDVIGIDDLVQGGNRDDPVGSVSDAGATVTFTAGAGGTPRPIELAGEGLAARAVEVAAARRLVPDDVTVVVFHPSHPFERAVTIYPALVSAAVLAFAESEATVDRAILEVQPTFGHVPVESVRAVAATVRSRLQRNRGVKRLVARWWERSAHDAAGRGGSPSRAAVAVVGRPAMKSLGWGRMRSILVTSVSLPAADLATFRALGRHVDSGYAVVEAGGLMGVGDGRRFRTVGSTAASCPDGVLVVTNELGAFVTGDRAQGDGSEFVVDGPVATMTELADGSSVLTADVERALRESGFISLARVANDSGRLSARIEVDAAAVGEWASNRRLLFTTLATLVELDDVQALLAAEVGRLTPQVAHHELSGRPLAPPHEITRTRTTVHGRTEAIVFETTNNNRGTTS